MRWIIYHIAALLVVAFATASSANAQTIRVQSGDHPGFTRLVLPIGAEREWDLTQQGNQWELTLSPSVDGFDTSSAFNLIQRNRLAELGGAQSLSLDLACACDVSSFRHDSRFLVIDISDPDPNAAPPQPQEIDPTAEARATAAEALPDLASLLRTPSDLPSIASPLARAPEPAPIEAAPPNPRLAEAAQIMAEQLARAAASGLLDVALDQPMTAGDPTEQSQVQAPEAQPDINVPPTPNPHDALPIRAQTAFDTVIQLELPISPPSEAVSCSGAPFDVAEWSEGNGLYQSLGALRRETYDERNVLTEDGAIALAQHYLYYGFGAEAVYWLTQLEAPPDPLLHVAALVDGAETAPFIPVDTAEACSQGELLWRYMGGAITNPLSGDDTAAIQRAFGDLPPGLRDHMGPRLAMQLVDEGYAGTARNIRDILHRGGRLDEVTMRLLDLDMGIAVDASPEQLQEELAQALRDDGGDPATVLAHAMAFDRTVGTLPSPSRLVTADALVREIGDGPQTDDLWRETLLGHAALGQIDEALNRLGDPARSETARAEALSDLIAERVSVGDTAALVILAYTYGRDWRPEGSAEGRVQVQAIAALREEGLFEAAQILRDVRRPLILPAPDPEPEAPGDDAATAWEDRNWERLADTGTGPHATIAARLVQLESTDPTPRQEGLPNLDELSATLSDSRTLRTEITELLARPALP